MSFPIHRVGYKLELCSPLYGFQWIYTEFDAFSQDRLDYGIPRPNGKIIQRKVHNLTIRSSDGNHQTGLANGHIEYTAYNYAPGNNLYDTSDDIESWMLDGNYGCMQIHCGTYVLWAYNRHNDDIQDIGIGNNVGNVHKDWTFMGNSAQYTFKRLRVYFISNEFDPFLKPETPTINMSGVAHGDSLIYNARTHELTQTQIPFIANGNVNQPNFIIALTGQSNSQGWNALYDSSESDDQPHERIFGFNATSQAWEVADLQTESIGSSWHKPLGSQCLAFHFARRLVEAYPHIRPGIINLGFAGMPIACWAKFPEDHKWYGTNTERAQSFDISTGYFYDIHVQHIGQALALLPEHHRKLNVICWHQGEADGWSVDPEYYNDCLHKVIQQYRSEPFGYHNLPFVVGETTGGDVGTDLGWEARNVQLRQLNFDADPFSKCVMCTDLEPSHSQYNNNDVGHFSARAQRIMGTRYFRAFRSMFESSNSQQSSCLKSWQSVPSSHCLVEDII